MQAIDCFLIFYSLVLDPAEKPGIYVCTANGLFCKRIIAGNRDVAGDAAKRQTYRGLALHPTAGKMVWIELYNRKHKIMIANMDGSDVFIVLGLNIRMFRPEYCSTTNWRSLRAWPSTLSQMTSIMLTFQQHLLRRSTWRRRSAMLSSAEEFTIPSTSNISMAICIGPTGERRAWSR